jgi:hypothetical protein
MEHDALAEAFREHAAAAHRRYGTRVQERAAAGTARAP